MNIPFYEGTGFHYCLSLNTWNANFQTKPLNTFTEQTNQYNKLEVDAE